MKQGILAFAVLISWFDRNPGKTEFFRVWRASKNCNAARTGDFVPIATLPATSLQYRDPVFGRCYVVTSITGGAESSFSSRATPR